ncbi:DNA polymerase III subunit epsilon [Rhizobium leguminosarum]|uniref:DNA polymerase III subunit epsilon n=1 Tax=Rhizobium leguminosarum TaxID=384 RepID=UPI001C954958|nr:DNA polymerase III subunit epsilon [Rhizobium leguminosarum]MBY5518539.1 DNA polymerase III subunit epsilon [Rhizobium leguminosarum]MBY5540336.1 DNA polymerase III subunit epsilon [Rhizobium leguminosarum]MBY5759787.1 DNA polymerase III subunit epsilon [Rhizobium leguminosarum]
MLIESSGILSRPVVHKSRIRVVDIETAGNGPNDVCEIGWQDGVFGHDGEWRVDDERGSLLINPGRPISPETMAIHHIVDAQVATAPFWKEIASSVLRPEGGAIALAAHRAAFEQRYCTPRFTGGATWICTWKCALRLWPELPRFSNQMLRYLRMPEGLVHAIGLPAHRAMPDAYVTAHHLRDMLNESTFEQLVKWSSESGLLPRIPSGPERGKSWDRLDIGALQALACDRDADVRFSAGTELRRRGDADVKVAAEAKQGTLL